MIIKNIPFLVLHTHDNCTKGGICIRRLGGNGTKVEGGCVYGLEVPSVDRAQESKDEVV